METLKPEEMARTFSEIVDRIHNYYPPLIVDERRLKMKTTTKSKNGNSFPYCIMGRYGNGWEWLNDCKSYSEAVLDLRDYEINEPAYMHAIFRNKGYKSKNKFNPDISFMEK